MQPFRNQIHSIICLLCWPSLNSSLAFEGSHSSLSIPFLWCFIDHSKERPSTNWYPPSIFSFLGYQNNSSGLKILELFSIIANVVIQRNEPLSPPSLPCILYLRIPRVLRFLWQGHSFFHRRIYSKFTLYPASHHYSTMYTTTFHWIQWDPKY